MLRIGMLPFINGLVPNARFQPQGASLHFDLPAKLNAMLFAGDLDVSAVSSFEVLNHSHTYYVWPHLMIASRGYAGSVTLFCRKDLQSLHQKRVLLSGASQTSIHLAQLLLQQRGIEPNYVTQSPEESQKETASALLADFEGAVLIGDQAQSLRFKTEAKAYDLAALWYAKTRLPFVFALWAVRKDAWARHPVLMTQNLLRLTSSSAWALTHLQDLHKEDARGLDYREFSAFLGRNLHYFPGPSHWIGLGRFARELLKAGFLKQPARLEYLHA